MAERDTTEVALGCNSLCNCRILPTCRPGPYSTFATMSSLSQRTMHKTLIFAIKWDIDPYVGTSRTFMSNIG